MQTPIVPKVLNLRWLQERRQKIFQGGEATEKRPKIALLGLFRGAGATDKKIEK